MILKCASLNVLHPGVSLADSRPPPTVLCDFCGQLFETRKALSCHVRAHLRHLGLTWSIKTSPIALLKEVMIQGVEGRRESAPCGPWGKSTWSPQGSRRSLDSLQKGEPDSRPCSSPLDFSMKDKSPSGKSGASHQGRERLSSSLLDFLFKLFVLLKAVSQCYK